MTAHPDLAPAGTLWLCAACGRTHPTRTPTGDGSGWDESCMLNAVLVYERLLADGRSVAWVAVPDSTRSPETEEP